MNSKHSQYVSRISAPRYELLCWWMLPSVVLSPGVRSCGERGRLVSVSIGFVSGDLSTGFSSSLSWWIQRSGGFTSLELPLYLWEPLTDLHAALFLMENIQKMLMKRLEGKALFYQRNINPAGALVKAEASEDVKKKQSLAHCKLEQQCFAKCTHEELQHQLTPRT